MRFRDVSFLERQFAQINTLNAEPILLYFPFRWRSG